MEKGQRSIPRVGWPETAAHANAKVLLLSRMTASGDRALSCVQPTGGGSSWAAPIAGTQKYLQSR